MKRAMIIRSYMLCLVGVISIFLATGAFANDEKPIRLLFDVNSIQQAFGVSHLSQVLKDKGYSPQVVDRSEARGNEKILVTILSNDASIQKEGFSLVNKATGIELRAIDETGAMYGLLELADLIQIHGLEKIPGKTVNPRFPFRAIKFNLPWSSYRRHEALQQHAETVRDLKYWEGFLDMMAENRFNSLTLWSLHPFSYMIRPTNFPEACPFDDDELKEWQSFWHTLFQMAMDRGIETYLVNWNIFGSEGFVKNYDSTANVDLGKYFIESNNSQTIEQYTKECVTQVIDEYPNLTGLGISLGEGMHDMNPVEREEWITRTFVAGISEASRKIKFIHRVPFTAAANNAGSTDRATETMTREAIESLDVIKPVWVEIKFNWSHGHSTPNLVQVHGGSISDAYWNPLPKNYAITWMIRNEDFYILRWGEPDFIRKHIAQNGHSYVGGYFVGSECYIPAKEYVHVQGSDHINWTYSWERQWLYYKEWGRLLYDPMTQDRVFELDFDRRFGEGIGSKMVEAYKQVSKMPLRFASYIFSGADFTLYSEAMTIPNIRKKYAYDDGHSPFLSLEELMDYQVLDPDYISVKDYVQTLRDASLDDTKITPLKLADELQQSGKHALSIVQGILPTTNHTLECEIMDVQAWSYQSLYFANKLRAAVALSHFKLSGDIKKKQEAVDLLIKAKEQWQNLVAVTRPHYQAVPGIQMKNINFTWAIYMTEVERDIEVAKAYE